MPEVSKTEIGRRFFKLQKEKNVEKAIERIRKNMGSDWALYTPDDYEAMKYVLGEAWVYIDREKWDKISFTRISRTDLRELIHIGRQVLDNIINEQSAVEQSSAILLQFI
ncbi:MAG TPA: hypothetical protein VMW63_05600 [Methanoregulaceae archaeon]|nr:hypothetical protein [Methanoregulaceae archaeon]